MLITNSLHSDILKMLIILRCRVVHFFGGSELEQTLLLAPLSPEITAHGRLGLENIFNQSINQSKSKIIYR